MQIYEETYVPDILHGIAENLLLPTMIIIILLILVCLFFIGQVLVEYFTERRHYKQNMAKIVNDIDEASYETIESVIIDSQLLRYQKKGLLVVAKNMGLGEEALFSLAQLQINAIESYYNKRLAWTDVISKVAPMLGLMGTLIPLGPGITALGQNNASVLSSALLLAFDATVCGLACAIVTLIISRIRGAWYAQYTNTVESLMSCIIDRAAEARKLGIQLPANYLDDPIAKDRAAKKAKKEVKKEAKTTRDASGVPDSDVIVEGR